MAAGGVRDLENLGRLERRQIDSRDTGCIVAINEQPAPIGHAIGLRELWMVRVIPGDHAEGRLEHRLRLFVITVPAFGILREDWDRLDQSSGRERIDRDLSAEAAAEEPVELVVRARRNVDVRGGVTGDQIRRAGTAARAAGE